MAYDSCNTQYKIYIPTNYNIKIILFLVCQMLQNYCVLEDTIWFTFYWSLLIVCHIQLLISIQVRIFGKFNSDKYFKT